MSQQRWLRIIPVALIMYTISYVDRTNVSLALDPTISTMLKDLGMDDRMKGEAAGIFFIGYILLQIPAGYWAARWSPRKLISILLVFWGLAAVGCGLASSFRQFEAMRFLLGVAESGVFPATMVLLANWFPSAERARATAYWTLCQPIAIAATAPLTAWLLGVAGWQITIVIEGALPFIWLPIWWFFIRDHPAEAKWLRTSEREFLQKALRSEAQTLQTRQARSPWTVLCQPLVLVMIGMYFLQNCAAYGCMTFFTTSLKSREFTAVQYGLLFAAPYALTALFMILNSWHSDKYCERRKHVAAVYALTGLSLIAAVLLRDHFWTSYFLLCLAIPGPFAAMGPFWAVPAEVLPRSSMAIAVGMVNAFGNIGGFVGPYVTGALKQAYQTTAVPFSALGAGMLLAAALAFLLPQSRQETRA
jgi:MFS family permease